MPAPIIAAYDPYAEDRSPVVLALAAAEATGSPVVAVAVHAWTPAKEAVAAMRRLHDDLGVETTIVDDVSVPRGLHITARAKRAGLIVVGSTRRGRTGRVVTGSTAERLLQGAPCPVALAPSRYERAELKTIAVGFVDTPEGHEALAAAHALAVRFGARLRVVTVLHPAGGFDAAKAGGLRPPKSYMLEGRHRADAEAAVDRAIAALGDGAEVERELHVDDPADVLLRISEHVDLLVCGSRGYGPVRSVLLGGVSRRLVDEAHCPVLVLPREAGRPLGELIDITDTASA
jgi:nucleotide-binding universal stress UspA family protein